MGWLLAGKNDRIRSVKDKCVALEDFRQARWRFTPSAAQLSFAQIAVEGGRAAAESPLRPAGARLRHDPLCRGLDPLTLLARYRGLIGELGLRR
jgi:hypothetical protein